MQPLSYKLAERYCEGIIARFGCHVRIMSYAKKYNKQTKIQIRCTYRMLSNHYQNKKLKLCLYV